MTEAQHRYLKLHMGSVYGSTARKRGRPQTCGVGSRTSVYFPVKTKILMDRMVREWGYHNRSEFIQEAIARYAAELDAVNKEAVAFMDHSTLDPCLDCPDRSGCVGGECDG